MRLGRVALVIGCLALVGAVPAVLTALKIETPWIVGAGAVIAALAGVAAGLWQERFKRLAQRKDEQRFKVADGLLTLKSGRVPKVRQVRDPLVLGVHPSAPATVKGHARSRQGAGDRVPVYVPRDIDAELRDCLGRGGFVLLVGDSTAGKSRSAFEAIHARLPDHELFVPADKNAGKDVMAAIIDRINQSRRAVLWLDDLEHYLRTGAITPTHISRIVNGKGHKAIVATLRSAEDDELTQAPADADPGQRALMEQAGKVLELARRIRVERMFSPPELENARAKADDERIADALDYADTYGIAEYLAAGPHLQDAYDNAWAAGRNPRGAALVAAAIDCRRAGYLSPLPKALLEELHQSYLDERGGRRLRPEPLEQAWAWATRQRRATAALLQPVDDNETQVEVFDYLVDRHQKRVGPTAHVPDHTVSTMLAHAATPDIEAIAWQMWRQGRYTLAAQALRQAVKAHRESDGEQHPSTLTSRNNLATVLGDLGRLGEAEAELRAVVEVCRRVLGEEHPDTLASRGNLATVLRRLGRLGEAEAELRAVVEVCRRVLGEEHPDTLTSRGNLALVLRDLGRLGEAEAELRAVLEARCRVLGEEHPDTLTSRGNLATVLGDLGRLGEAEAELRAVLEARCRVLGEEHPDTLTSRGNLATVLRDLGRLGEAEAELRAVLEARCRVLGEEHPDTLTSRNNLAFVLGRLGRLGEAEAELRAVLEARCRLLGEEHPSTLTSRNNLALVLRDLGRLGEAEAELRAVLEARCRVLGEEHPSTLTSRNNLALVLGDLGRLEEAEAEHRAVLEARCRLLGEEHPTRNN